MPQVLGSNFGSVKSLFKIKVEVFTVNVNKPRNNFVILMIPTKLSNDSQLSHKKIIIDLLLFNRYKTISL